MSTGSYFAAYDTTLSEIERVFEDRDDCRDFCDDNNAHYAYQRYVVEPVPASEWADEDVWESA